MKKLITKKVFAFIIVAIMFSAYADAQIIYTDVNPDDTLACISPCTDIYNLDLNNDGINDYQLLYNTSIYTTQIIPLFSNQLIYKTQISPCGLGAARLDSNTIISNTINPYIVTGWIDTNTVGVAWTAIIHHHGGSVSYQSCGQWTSAQNKYLGLKLISGTNIFYGWARLTLLSGNKMVIKNYACNSISNQPILAGETSCVTPTVTLTVSGSLSFCAGDSVTLTANGTGYKYQWKKNNINIAGATAKKYVAKTPGVYKCKVTNSCGSKTSGTRTVTIPCRISDQTVSENLEQLFVYPNPASNSVIIKFPSDEEGTIQIVNLFGQIVFSEKIKTEEEQIDVSKFSGGMYVVRWSSGENFEMKKFSVVR